MAGLQSYLPLMLLGTGSSAAIAVLLLLLEDKGILNLFGDEGKTGTNGSPVSGNAPTSVYDYATTELEQTGTMSERTLQIMEEDIAMRRSVSENDKIISENERAVKEAEALPSVEAERTDRTVTALGILGGAAAGAVTGGVVTSWTGPGLLVGATVGAVIGGVSAAAGTGAIDIQNWKFW